MSAYPLCEQAAKICISQVSSAAGRVERQEGLSQTKFCEKLRRSRGRHWLPILSVGFSFALFLSDVALNGFVRRQA